MRAYEEYKESGYDWLGKIPAHWRKTKLRELTKESNERRGQRQDLELLSVYREFGVIIKNSRDDNHNSESEDTSNYKYVNKNYLVINKMKLWQGSLGISEFEGIVSPAYIVCKITKEINTRYLNYLLRSPLFKTYYNRISYGIRVGQWDSDYDDLKQLDLFLPPREEQDAIVRFLDAKCAKIDRLIKLKERQIELLNEKKQNIINQAVTKGLDPHAPMKDSGVDWIGEIPEWWEVSKLKYIGTVQTGVTLGKDYPKEMTVEYPYLCVANVQDGYIDLEKVKSINLPPKEAERYFLQKGDILMTEGGDPDKLGRGSIWNSEIETCLHQNHIFAVRMNQQKILIEFFRFVLQSRYCKEYFLLSAKQTTNLASTNKTTLSNLCVAIPSFGEQKKIVKWLDEITAIYQQRIKIIEEASSTLREYKTRVISDVVTGKVAAVNN